MTSKPNWEGKFNWHGEILTYHRHAHSQAEAKVLMLVAMAKDVGHRAPALFRKYDGSRDNFEIRRI
jgi:hypothetical protein